jgi:signal transduction histidine kinase/HAMP domain-containing protein
MLARLGIRGRLLIAFFGISALAVIGAAAALYSFRAIDDTLALITQRRLPIAVNSQELSRHAERIVAAAPALLTTTSQAEKDEWSRLITSEVNALNELMAKLHRTGDRGAALKALEANVEHISNNLHELNVLVNNRLILVSKKRELLGKALRIVGDMQGLLAPWISVMDDRITQWRRSARNPTIADAQRDAADLDFEKTLASFRALQNSESLASSVSDLLQRVASADEASAVGVSEFRLQQSLNGLETLAAQLDPKLKSLMLATITQLRPLATGNDSIAEMRQRELAMTANGTRLLQENTELSKQLTTTAQGLVTNASNDITEANEQALSSVRFSTWALVTAVVLSLISSALIVWLYLGRNVIARLTALSNRMLTLARGDLNSPLPQSGPDEIGHMAESLAVFRDNAAALNKLLGEREQAAQRLEEVVRERTDELARSVEELRALGEVSQTVNSTLDLETVLSAIVSKATQLSGTEAGTIYVFSEARRGYQLRATYGMPESLIDAIKNQHAEISKAVALTIEQRRPTQTPDLRAEPPSVARDIMLHAGYLARLVVPLLGADSIVGALVVRRQAPGEFPKSTIELLQTFATQSVLAIQNARLFSEIEEKSRQLEEASQHKSQFLANMSHELRTPLNAILGYAELMADGAYGEPSEKMLGVLKRLESNGKHLLGLINDVLDLSKIEAGQLVLELSDYSIQDIAQTVRSTLEPLAADKKLGFKLDLAPELPPGHGDGRRLTQVLINLVGNAIKFTDAGEVAIKAEAKNGSFHVSVRDTGPGISTADQAKLFQEFQQADNAITRRKGGTGLGLAISKRIIEMHGGRIWVDSQPGQGSTFTFTLSVIVERQVEAA